MEKKYLHDFSFLRMNIDANTVTLKEYVTLILQYQWTQYFSYK